MIHLKQHEDNDQLILNMPIIYLMKKSNQQNFNLII